MNIPYTGLSVCEKRSLYARINHDYLNMEAIFSDESERYVTPYDPDPGTEVTIRLRTGKNDIEKACLHMTGLSSESVSNMVRTGSDELFDYYAASRTVTEEPVRYFFSVYKAGRIYFYNKRGLYDTANPEYHFRLVPGFHTPEWAKGAVMYQIFVDRFCNGDPSNDPVNYEYVYLGRPAKKLAWDQAVYVPDMANFYGGDLQGIMDKMNYLQSLGVEAIFLNPIFVSPSSHKYDIQDYDHVDPHFGVLVHDEGSPLSFEKLHNRYATKYISRTTDRANLEASDALLAEMIEKAHEHGIKVILDGVFNHCGAFNKWMDKAGFYSEGDYPPGAYRDKESPYHDYFLWFDHDWPNNDCYDSWWGNENHPKMNFEAAPELFRYILDIARKWVSPPYNADGWRLDMAADLGRSPAFNHRFWRDFRVAVKEANPEAIILAEHYGDASAWLSGGEWDTVMNYDAFMEPITWFLTGMEKHSEDFKPQMLCNTMAFESAMRYYMARFNIHALLPAMNELSNHDHSRFLTRTNHKVGRLHTVGSEAADTGVDRRVMMEAVVFQMTWLGAPTLYYGDEAGMTGWTDPDSRRPFPWGAEDETLLAFHRALIALRKKHTALRTGSIEFLHNDYGILSFARWDVQERIAVALNNNEGVATVSLPVWKTGCVNGTMERLMATYSDKVYTEKRVYPVVDGMVRVTLPGFSSLILWQGIE